MGIPLRARDRDEIQVEHRQLGERRQCRLHADRGLFRIDPGREIVERDLDNVAAHLVGVVGVVDQRLRVGQQQELAVRLLHHDTVF